MDAARKLNLWNEKGKAVTVPKHWEEMSRQGHHRKCMGKPQREQTPVDTCTLSEAAPGRQHDPSSGESLVPSIRVLGAWTFVPCPAL